jgi:hypothetical protein
MSVTTPCPATKEEQLEVEGHFIEAGLLFPECHQIYWIGLRAKSWPRFSWLDSLLPSPGQQPRSRQCATHARSLHLYHNCRWHPHIPGHTCTS